MPVFSRFVRYFDEVAKRGSVRSAAEGLHITPSAVDRQIILAEESLGVALFDRLPQGMRLTPAGEHLIHHLRRWNREYDSMLDELGNIHGLGGGRVSLALTEAFTGELIGELLARFHREHPRVFIATHMVKGGEVRELILSGLADIGITFMSTAFRSMRVEHSVDLPLGLLMRTDNPLAGAAAIPLRECSLLPIVLPSPEHVMRRNFDDALALEGVSINPVAVADNAALMRAMVGKNIGIGVATKAHIFMDVRDGRFAFVPLEGEKIARSVLSLVTPSHPSPAAIKLLAAVRDVMDEVAT